jgi:hypoxanthine-DNA glycosylase
LDSSRGYKIDTKGVSETNLITDYTKTSFEPISNTATEILILGSMPGDKSLELSEYYGHPRNRFWMTVASITVHPLPTSYSEKISLLLQSNIGLWDVAHTASRKGSLDSAIKDEEPNDIDSFIANHRNLKVICFNGIKAQSLYDKYFKRQNGINYFLLSSTSPANTSFDAERWKGVLAPFIKTSN